jgi:type II secretory pathway component PulJ
MEPPRTYSSVMEMRQFANPQEGFTILEALIGLLFSAMIAVAVLQLLGTDMIQSRRIISRNEESSKLSKAFRVFADEATRASGQANDRNAGNLVITPNGLMVNEGSQPQPLYLWKDGKASLAYSSDGRTWRPATARAENEMIRFTWSDGVREIVWFQP